MTEKTKRGCNIPKVSLLIREIMKKKGVTLEALARRLGVTSSTMNIKLRGNITLNALYDIAQALDCEIADFFPVPEGYRHWKVSGETNSQAAGVITTRTSSPFFTKSRTSSAAL